MGSDAGSGTRTAKPQPSLISDLDNVHWEVKPEWSSKVPDHSATLHKRARDSSRLEAPHYSVSHCPEAGGYAWILPPFQVGFDIEVQDRLRKETVQRIASIEEVRSAPSLAALWCAKEATFKSLFGPQQPRVLSDITIYDWHSKALPFFIFSWKVDGLGPLSGLGKIKNEDRLTLGISIYRP